VVLQEQAQRLYSRPNAAIVRRSHRLADVALEAAEPARRGRRSCLLALTGTSTFRMRERVRSQTGLEGRCGWSASNGVMESRLAVRRCKLLHPAAAFTRFAPGDGASMPRKSTSKPKKPRVTVSLDKNIHDRLLRFAKAEDRPLASVVRLVINSYLDSNRHATGSDR